jgi:hypothetical protein
MSLPRWLRLPPLLRFHKNFWNSTCVIKPIPEYTHLILKVRAVFSPKHQYAPAKVHGATTQKATVIPLLPFVSYVLPNNVSREMFHAISHEWHK